MTQAESRRTIQVDLCVELQSARKVCKVQAQDRLREFQRPKHKVREEQEKPRPIKLSNSKLDTQI